MGSQVDLEKARQLAQLEAEAKGYLERLGDISSKLNSLKYDMRLSGWDWKRAGSTTSICPQGRIGMSILPLSDRDK